MVGGGAHTSLSCRWFGVAGEGSDGAASGHGFMEFAVSGRYGMSSVENREQRLILSLFLVPPRKLN